MSRSFSLERAIATMLDRFVDNEWFMSEYWPINEPHVRRMIADVIRRRPPGPGVHVLDVGCFNG
jgi:hypothetical protein